MPEPPDARAMTVRIAGVRPPPTSPLWDGGHLRFADAGSLPLMPGDWVVVEVVGGTPGEPWVGEVVVAPEQVVEAVPLGMLPRILRPAGVGERPPARTEGAGLRLLRSLDLPDSATHPGPALP
jgi:hypothetical protein